MIPTAEKLEVQAGVAIRWLTPEQVARRLGYEADTVRKWCREGRVPHAQPVRGGAIRIPEWWVEKQELRAGIIRRRRGSTPAGS